jgi:hypothetical protein
MRFFVWPDFQYDMIALFLGAISLILVYLAWAGYPQRRIARTMGELEERRRSESEHHPEKNRITPFLVCTYLLIAAWSFSYLIFVWANGSRF